MSKIWKVKDGGDTDQGTDININEITSKLEKYQCQYLSENPVKFNSDSPSSQYQNVVVQVTNEDTLNSKFNKAGFYIIKDLNLSDSLFIFQFNIESMLNITRTEFNDADVTLIPSGSEENASIRVSWKFPSSKKGSTERYQPVIISLHEDFSTSEFSQNTTEVIRIKYSTFLKNERTKFKTRPKKEGGKIHPSNYWIFPQDC